MCVEAGHLSTAVEFYETVLDFDMVFTERIVVGRQAMESRSCRAGPATSR
ncbi:hypothetical protein NKH77_09155 [Streptomyces sp. M19]